MAVIYHVNNKLFHMKCINIYKIMLVLTITNIHNLKCHKN